MKFPHTMTPKHALDRLTEMGYFKFLSDPEFAVAQIELVASLSRGYLGTEWNEECVSRDKRTYPADSEELAEGRVGEFVVLMQDALAHEGVSLESVEDDFDDDSEDQAYAVFIEGRRYPIHDTNILKIWSSWTIATKRFLEVVNELLESQGSNERLYGTHGGNDGRAIFLTEEMFEFIKSSGLISDGREMPYPSSAINKDGTIQR